jgi:hypothetical protein
MSFLSCADKNCRYCSSFSRSVKAEIGPYSTQYSCKQIGTQRTSSRITSSSRGVPPRTRRGGRPARSTPSLTRQSCCSSLLAASRAGCQSPPHGSSRCTVYCVLCTVYCVLCTVHCVLCTVYCVLCTVHCVLCTVYCVLCTVSNRKREEARPPLRQPRTERPNGAQGTAE